MGHGTTPIEHRTTHGAQTVGLAAGLATFAAAYAELPAVRATCLPEDERGRVAARLADGWNLAAFTPTGAVLLAVLDAGGASIEVVGGVPATWGRGRRGVEGRGVEGRGDEGRGVEGRGDEGVGRSGDAGIPRATSHGAARAAWGAPPGRRIAAMGLVPGPDGEQLRMSCALVLRLPAAAIEDPAEVATILAWHAAMHAAERRGLPAPPAVAAAIDAVDHAFAIPRHAGERVAWAAARARGVAEELALPLRAGEASV